MLVGLTPEGLARLRARRPTPRRALGEGDAWLAVKRQLAAVENARAASRISVGPVQDGYRFRASRGHPLDWTGVLSVAGSLLWVQVTRRLCGEYPNELHPGSPDPGRRLITDGEDPFVEEALREEASVPGG